jgi:hypothetical protein
VVLVGLVGSALWSAARRDPADHTRDAAAAQAR